MKKLFPFLLFMALCIVSCGVKSTNNAKVDYSEIDSVQTSQMMGQKIDTNVSVVNSRNDTLSLADVLSDTTLYVRFSTYACKDCIEFTLSKLMEAKLPFVAFVSNMPVRDLHVHEVDNKGMTMYLVPSISLDFDEGLTPYVFTQSREQVNRIFIPRKETPGTFDDFMSEFKL